jgi:glycosyltransferase involved in cell wall biosynthesis
MPVHNGAAFVERAIRSVLAQTFANWELIVVDDGSGDDSYERVCRLAALDARIRPFRLEVNRGPGAARNHALRQARGATIAYLDCDDEYYLDYLGRVHAWRGRADVLVCGYDLVEERPEAPNRGDVSTYNPVPHRARILEVNVATPLGVAHSRALLDRVGLFDETLYFEQDWDLWKRFHRAGADFLYSDRKSGLYHVRSDSQARTQRIPDAARDTSASEPTPAPPT